MRDIRSRIAKSGIELTDQQVQELAARRLDSILDPRSVKPSLLDQLRRAAGMPPESARTGERAEPPYTFDEATLYDSPNAFVRFMRRLLNPILKLFFDPNALIRPLEIQSRFNMEAGRREAERDRRQAEWNALHYDILKRLVAEVSKVSIEMQSLALRVESLSAKVDFNERRVRGIEGTVHQARPGGGQRERERERDRDRDRDRNREMPQPAAAAESALPEAAPVGAAPVATGQGEAPRRRRRRRRGRRGGGGGLDVAVPAGVEAEPVSADGEGEGDDLDEGPESDAIEAVEFAPAASAPERVTPQLETAAPEAREAAAPELPPAAPPEADRNEPQ